MSLKKIKFTTLLSCCLASGSLLANEIPADKTQSLEKEITNLVSSITGLREDIESLQGELSSKKEEMKTQINTLVINRSELEKDLSGLSKEYQSLSEENASLKKDIAQNDVKISEMLPLFSNTCKTLNEDIENGLPYKKLERFTALREMCTAEILSKKVALTTTAFFKLWSFLEDEIRFSEEISLATTEITYDKKIMLVESIKVGSYAWFAKTPDDQYLVYSKEDKTFSKASSEEEHSIRNLIIALKRNIRTGKMAIPLDKKTVSFIKG